jgi:cytochrome P450
MPFYAVFVDEMRKRVEDGSAPDCFVTRLLQDDARAHWKEHEYHHVVAELMTAGTETTATTLQWFFKAAILNPEPIKRARKEIDDVVGRSRMPEWSDRSNLPYVNALVDELHRWASAAPLSFFHATSEDDVYRGKHIAKGTVVIPNSYAIHTNPAYYPEPDRFMPERFLDPNHPLAAPEANPNRRHFGFSVGRRECPGMHVADASLYIMISRIIWAFDVRQKPGAAPGPGYSKSSVVHGSDGLGG